MDAASPANSRLLLGSSASSDASTRAPLLPTSTGDAFAGSSRRASFFNAPPVSHRQTSFSSSTTSGDLLGDSSRVSVDESTSVHVADQSSPEVLHQLKVLTEGLDSVLRRLNETNGNLMMMQARLAGTAADVAAANRWLSTSTNDVTTLRLELASMKTTVTTLENRFERRFAFEVVRIHEKIEHNNADLETRLERVEKALEVFQSL